MVIRGDTNIIKAYDLTPVVNLDEYNFDEISDIERFKEVVGSYIDAGELEAINLPTDLIGVVPDSADIEISDKYYTFEDVEYINKSVDELISEHLNTGDVILLFQANGDGYFEYEENPDIDELKIGYTACDIETPDENIYNFFCDLMLVDLVEVNGEKLPRVASNFYPKDKVVAEVYVVREGDGKYLERVAEIDVLHEHWDLFEDIIQVDYDEPIA